MNTVLSLKRVAAMLVAGLSGAAALAVGPDLNVTLIERTPRYSYHDTKDKPDAGETVTFHGHIRYWGSAGSTTLPSVDYAWRVDGQTVATGTITNFEPLLPPYDFDWKGYNLSSIRDSSSWPYNVEAYDPADPPTGLRVVTYSMPLPDYPDFSDPDPNRPKIELVVDPSDAISESEEQNNIRSDYMHAIIAGFWVEESVWQYFHENQYKLGAGSNSWEDWIHRHMDRQNQYYAEAVWPGVSPHGVLDRVRIGRIIVVPDDSLPLTGGTYAGNHPDRYDYTIDIMWGFETALLPPNTFYSDHHTAEDGNAFFFEPSLIHELGHARYLIDHYGYDIHNTADRHSVQICEGGTFVADPTGDRGWCEDGGVYVAGSSYMPFLAFGEVLYYNQTGGIMSGPYGFQWSPAEAGALNRIAGERACCGHYNSPGNLGDYVDEIPNNNHYQFVDEFGFPRPGAEIEVYRPASASGLYAKRFDDTPDLFYTADASGYVNFGHNPFSTSDLSPWHWNTVMVLRVEHLGQVWYRFVESAYFNIEYFKGNTENAYYSMALPGANIGDSDADGLQDDWENNELGTMAYDGDDDVEPDGLTNAEEQAAGTSPDDADTDSDGLTDSEELEQTGTDPLDADTDNDNVDDGVDNCPLDSNPGQFDGDGDGLGDACDPLTDCNGNAIPDADDIAGGMPDCNANGIPDECDISVSAPLLVDDIEPIYGSLYISPLNGLGLTDNGAAEMAFSVSNGLFEFDSVQIHNNGAIGFDGTTGLSFLNDHVPNQYAFGGAQALFVLWDDLDDDTGDVYAQLFPFTGNQMLAVEWRSRPHYRGDAVLDGDEVTIQAQVFEYPIGNVYAQILYDDVTFDDSRYDGGASATIGYQADGTRGLEYSYNVASVSDGVCLSLIAQQGESVDENGNGVPDECEQAYAVGDLNCDGAVNSRDIDGFVLAITSPGDYATTYPDCDASLADCNGDGEINSRDIDAFVALLTGS